MTIPIIVDSREPEDIVGLLKSMGADVRVEMMEDGDYRIGDWLCTRKTIKDLFNSRNTGHLNDELVRLVAKYINYFMIVEKNTYNTRDEMKIAHKTVESLRFILPVLRTKSLRDTAETLIHIRDKISKNELGRLMYKPVIYGASNALLKFYMSLPGIGLKGAMSLAEKYPHPIDFILDVYDSGIYNEAIWDTKKQWKEERWSAGVDGIGEKRFKDITRFILYGLDGDEK